jgi:hypothetical protein
MFYVKSVWFCAVVNCFGCYYGVGSTGYFPFFSASSLILLASAASFLCNLELEAKTAL